MVHNFTKMAWSWVPLGLWPVNLEDYRDKKMDVCSFYCVGVGFVGKRR